jgi:hypothetical protein
MENIDQTGAVVGFIAISFLMVLCNHNHNLNGRSPVRSRGLVVRKTSIKGCDFDGLFTSRAFLKGEVLCKYTGKIMRTSNALKLQDKSYLMRLGVQCYVDSRESVEVKARCINDCITPGGWNVEFQKRPEELCAYVVALRDIAVNEEVFVNYGKW